MNQKTKAKQVAVLPKLYDLILWYAPKISNYTKKYKYTLGGRITNSMLNILETIIEAKYSSNKLIIPSNFLRDRLFLNKIKNVKLLKYERSN